MTARYSRRTGGALRPATFAHAASATRDQKSVRWGRSCELTQFWHRTKRSESRDNSCSPSRLQIKGEAPSSCLGRRATGFPAVQGAPLRQSGGRVKRRAMRRSCLCLLQNAPQKKGATRDGAAPLKSCPASGESRVRHYPCAPRARQHTVAPRLRDLIRVISKFSGARSGGALPVQPDGCAPAHAEAPNAARHDACADP